MKALSRKRKGGRPRKAGPRYANGNRKESFVREETEKEARSVVIDARQRIFGMTEDQAKSDLAGTLLGRLYMAKHITKQQFEAGERYAHDVWRYSVTVLGVTPTVQAQNMLKVKGHQGDDDDTAQRRIDRITAAWVATETVLGTCPIGSKATLRSVCVTEEDACGDMPMSQMALLRRGLASLARHYGIGDK